MPMNRTLPAFLLFIAVALLSAAPPPDWGPWLPLKDGGKNGVEISFKLWPNKTQYFKLRNTYEVAVKVECQFNFTDGNGKPSTEHGCGATLAPGQEKKDPGWFEWAVTAVDTGSLIAKVRRADNNASMGRAVGAAEEPGSKVAPFNILIQRGQAARGLVTGTISVNGQQIGMAYENDELKIPPGTYPGMLRYISGHNFVGGPMGTIGKTGDFLLEISGVPGGRTDILFHGGNQPQHSRGCILLGPVGRDPGSSIPSLDDQHPLRQMRLLFYGTDVPNSTPDEAITIQIQ